jgi:hypothetical protein
MGRRRDGFGRSGRARIVVRSQGHDTIIWMGGREGDEVKCLSLGVAPANGVSGAIASAARPAVA